VDPEAEDDDDAQPTDKLDAATTVVVSGPTDDLVSSPGARSYGLA
jgi:hypothetical protein